MTKDRLGAARTIVVKLGSALIVDKSTGQLREAWMCSLAEDVAALMKSGKRVLLVSSGAAAIGRALLKPDTAARLAPMERKQAAAALGQPRLMTALQSAFDPVSLNLAQALLTIDDTEQRRRWLNARAALLALLDQGVVPVINENDTVATEEIRYGDNDRLAARVAQMIGADVLVLLSDIDGLYTADPRTEPDAEHIPEVSEITPAIRKHAGTANPFSGVGTGGMITKLDAAEIAHHAGCTTVITLGENDHPLTRIQQGGRATFVLARTTPQAARMNWLSGHLTPEGSIEVDAGAAKALRAGASLLPVGIRGVSGSFMRGAAVSVQDTDGRQIAKGVTAYASSEIEQIRGLQSNDISDRLGYPARAAVIHRDDMVVQQAAK